MEKWVRFAKKVVDMEDPEEKIQLPKWVQMVNSIVKGLNKKKSPAKKAGEGVQNDVEPAG